MNILTFQYPHTKLENKSKMSSVNIAVLNALCNALDENKKSQDVESSTYNFDQIIVGLKNLSHFIIGNPQEQKKTLKKADLIRIENTKKIIANDIAWLDAQAESKEVMPIFRNWKLAESKMISMLIWGQKVILSVTDDKPLDKRVWYDSLMSNIRAAKEFKVNLFEHPTTTIESLYRHVYRLLSSQASITELFANYSDLLISDTYGKMYPSGIIKPYPAQQTVINHYTNSLKHDSPLFIQYSTETGSGKTYLSLVLIKALRNAISQKDYCKNTFIFVCYNPVVRKMILELCNSLKIPACHVETSGLREYTGKRVEGIFNLNSCAINDKGVSVGPSRSTGYDKQTGEKIKSGGNIRSRKSNGTAMIKQEWKKFDALTNEGSLESKVENQFKYLANISDHSFSFSAEFPHVFVADPQCATILTKIAPDSTVFIDEPDVDDKELASFYAKIVELCPKRIIVTSATVGDLSPEMKKFASIWNSKTENASTITASVSSGTSGIHTTLVNDGEICLPHMFVDLNDEKEFNRFMETLRNTSIIKLYSPLTLARMFEVFDENPLDELRFEDLSYDKIREFVIKFFDNVTDSQLDILQHQKLTWYNIVKPFTEDESHLSGQTLAINEKPYEQAKAWEDNLFANYNLKDSRKRYLEELTIYKNILESIMKNNVSKSQFRNGVSAAELNQKIAEHAKTEPSLHFPSNVMLGSREHRKRFAKSSKNPLANRIINVDDKLYNNADIELIQWLMAGVGFYDGQYHKHFNDEVLRAVSEHLLAMFLSTPELIRGMDHRFENVMLNKDFTQNASYSALRQAIGRVGRPGSNWALVIIDDFNAVSKLLSLDSSSKEVSLFKQALVGFVNRIEKEKINVEKFRKFTISKSISECKPEEFDDDCQQSAEDLKDHDEEEYVRTPTILDSWEDYNNSTPITKPKLKPNMKSKPISDEEWD